MEKPKMGKCPGCEKLVPVDEKSKLPIACNECTDPDWSGECEVCGASPIMPITGMCGPCTFGEAETANGNW